MSKKKNTDIDKLEAGESKEARFNRIVLPRINRAIKAISLIGNCSGSTYSYTPERVEAIREALVSTVSDTLRKFSGTKSNRPEFIFKDD